MEQCQEEKRAKSGAATLSGSADASATGAGTSASGEIRKVAIGQGPGEAGIRRTRRSLTLDLDAARAEDR